MSRAYSPGSAGCVEGTRVVAAIPEVPSDGQFSTGGKLCRSGRSAPFSAPSPGRTPRAPPACAIVSSASRSLPAGRTSAALRALTTSRISGRRYSRGLFNQSPASGFAEAELSGLPFYS
jgi:hypothetical protein